MNSNRLHTVGLLISILFASILFLYRMLPTFIRGGNNSFAQFSNKPILPIWLVLIILVIMIRDYLLLD